MKGFTKIDYGKADGARRIGIGVIGYGFMGKVHSNAWLKIPYSFAAPAAMPRLVAMCGRDQGKVLDIARRFGYVGTYTDWRQMMEDPEVQVVDVCTPDNEHSAPSIAAAQAGKHVICEKPQAMTVKDARAMADAARAAGVKNMLCHNYRFLPAVRLARDLVDKGVVGAVRHFRVRYLQEPGHDPATAAEDVWYASGTKSGVLLGIGSHIIDMARFLAGEIVSVSALVTTYTASRKTRAGSETRVDADEDDIAIVQFASGATGSLESSAVATGRKNTQGWELNGTRGSICFDLEDPNHLQVYSDDMPREMRGFSTVSVTDPGHPLQTVYLPPGHNAGWEYGHVHALHHFLGCVANDTPVAPYGTTFEDGWRVQVIMDAVRESSRTGRRIALQP
jgi:predicted dehydrogenase